MTRPPQKRQRRRWFLKEWRDHRGLTQEQLAERIGATQGLISQLENYRVDYTGELLQRLADALRCEAADLLMRNPTDPEAPWSIWDAIPPTQRPHAIDVLKTFKRASGE